MIVIAATLDQVTISESTDIPWNCMEGIRDFSMAVSGLVLWIRGQNTGQTIGMTTMTYTLSILMTAITFITAGIQGTE